MATHGSTANRRSPVVDQRPERVHRGLSGVEHQLRRRGHPARDPRREHREMERDIRMKLSVVVPARNEAGAIADTINDAARALEGGGIDYEILVIDDSSTDGTAGVVRELGRTNERVRCYRSHYSQGFGLAVRAGLERFEGDAVAILMADGSDDPDDLARYHRLLEDGYDCAFGSRFVHGADVSGYPPFKLVLNRIVNWGIRLLFRHGYNDTTNAFKAYRRTVI